MFVASITYNNEDNSDQIRKRANVYINVENISESAWLLTVPDLLNTIHYVQIKHDENVKVDMNMLPYDGTSRFSSL